MTYQELLEATAVKKQDAIEKLNASLNGDLGWLVRAEIEKDPGTIAWAMLAEDFCKTLAEHVGEFLEQCGDIDSADAREIGSIYMAYEDSDPDLYDMLPDEAKLFEA